MKEFALTPPKPRKAKAPDLRFAPFVRFAYDSYKEKRGVPLVLIEKDFGNLRTLLKATTEDADNFSLDRLKEYWKTFLDRASAFDKAQPPLTRFCTTINNWVELTGKPQTSTDVAREWLKGRLKK